MTSLRDTVDMGGVVIPCFICDTDNNNGRIMGGQLSVYVRPTTFLHVFVSGCNAFQKCLTVCAVNNAQCVTLYNTIEKSNSRCTTVDILGNSIHNTYSNIICITGDN